MALLSVIPFVGVLPAVVAIWHGGRTWRAGGWLIVALTAICLSTTAAPVIEHARYRLAGGLEADMEAVLRENLTWLVAEIEEFRNATGAYPESLSDLGDTAEVRLRTFDPTLVHGAKRTQGQSIYYELLHREHYVLFSKGPDGVPFTEDDIRPDPKPSAAPGYRPER